MRADRRNELQQAFSKITSLRSCPRSYRASPFSRRASVRALAIPCPSDHRGRREGRVSATPAAPVRKKCTGQEPQVKAEQSGLPCASGVNGCFALSSVSRACLPPSSRGHPRITARLGSARHLQDLAPASGRQDHTTSPSARNVTRPARACRSRKTALRSPRAQRSRVHRIPDPTSVTTRTSLLPGRDNAE
jgi:hypothetical protein